MQQVGKGSLFLTDIYLVDDGSSDGTGDAVESEYPEVRIIKGNGSLYWNGGMHKAWSEAAKNAYDYFMWLNDDTILFPEAIETLLRCKKNIDAKTIICGTTRSAKQAKATYGGKLIRSGIIEPKGYMEECELINGNCVLISKETFSLVGNLDPRFTHAIGDYDYGLRAKAMGVQLYIPGVFIGVCEKHDSVAKWCSPELSFRKRINALNSPLSVNPKQFFVYEYRHFGLLKAIFHFITIHIRVFMPSLWVSKS